MFSTSRILVANRPIQPMGFPSQGFRPVTFNTTTARYFATAPRGTTNTGAFTGNPSATPDGSSVRLDKANTTRVGKFSEDDVIQGDILKKVENAASSAKETVQHAAKDAKDYVASKVGSTGSGSVGVEKVKNIAQDAKEYATEKLHDLERAAGSTARSVGGKVMDAKDSVASTAEHLKNQAASAARNVTSGTVGSGATVDNVVGAVKNAAAGAVGAAQSVAQTATQKVQDLTQGSAAEKVIETAKHAAENVTGAAKSAFNAATGGALSQEEPMRPGHDDPKKFDHGKTGAEASNPNVARADELYVENQKNKTGKKVNNPNHI